VLGIGVGLPPVLRHGERHTNGELHVPVLTDATWRRRLPDLPAAIFTLR
jgi:hypothetical protein